MYHPVFLSARSPLVFLVQRILSYAGGPSWVSWWYDGSVGENANTN